MNGMALCAGVGGLELGLKLALGDDYRCRVYVERDAYAAATLVARMADASLDQAPIWDDVTTFDGQPWRGVVDIVAAGFPCQPWSLAGKRLGTDDERWIWDDIARVIRETEPRWVFLENVPGLVRGGLEHVLRDLAALGFDAEWDIVSASEIGATHRRERLFILAYARCSSDDTNESQSVSRGGGAASSGRAGAHVANANDTGCLKQRRPVAMGTQHATAERRRSAVADSGSCGRTPRVRNDDAGQPDAQGCCVVGDSVSDGQSFVGQSESGIWRDVDGHDRPPDFPPSPADAEAWRDYLAIWPCLEPAVCRGADGMAHRVDRLRVVGNGVVPVAAAVAFLRLRDRLEVLL